jgi:hypothetical protein
MHRYRLPVHLWTSREKAVGPPNKRMQLTKLRAAPERQDKVPPCARAASMDAGTASQLIRSVGPTMRAACVLGAKAPQ